MSFSQAKEMIKDGMQYVSADSEPAMHDLLAALYETVESLEGEFGRLHNEIEHISRQLAQVAQTQR